MKELNEEIKLTLDLMQTDIDDGAHGVLQGHLYSLLEMKRNKIQKRLDVEPYERGPIIGRAEPLTVEELMEGGWWCGDVSKECADAFKYKGLRLFSSDRWKGEGMWYGCIMDAEGDIARTTIDFDFKGLKQIHRIGNDFYWSEK